MNKALLTLGAICFAAVTLFTMTSFYSIQPPADLESSELPSSSSSSRTFFDVEFGLVKYCSSLFYTCQKDSGCNKELNSLERSFAADTSRYHELRASASNSNLVSLLKCTDQCGLGDFLIKCGDKIVQANKCAMDKNCREQNQMFFDKFSSCVAKEFQPCIGLKDAPFEICRNTEILKCEQEFMAGSDPLFSKAFLCTF